MTHLEKRQLIQRITSLSDEKLADVVGIIEKFNPQFDTGDDDEEDMEIDFEALNTETLRHLQHYIVSHRLFQLRPLSITIFDYFGICCIRIYIQTSLTIKKKKKRCGLPKLRGTLTELEAAQEVEAQIKAIIEQKRTELDALDEALDALDDIETLDALDSIEDEGMSTTTIVTKEQRKCINFLNVFAY